MIRKFLVVVLTLVILSGCTVAPKSFQDNFEEYNIGQKAPFGKWKLKQGEFVITAILSEDKKNLNKVAESINHGVIYVDENFSNFMYSVDIKRKEPSDQPRIYFGLQNNANSGYYIVLERNDMGYSLYKFNGSKVKLLNRSYSAAPAGTDFYRYQVVVKGNLIKFFAGGQLYITYRDNSTKAIVGGIGIGYGNGYYDNVRVEVIS
ncbi:family 16 glycoside hydrolase [Methanocaldococcus infernus]